ncbi:MAG: type II toxin-antitoxin system RelE/ParE family toxin [Chloroflexi bacterium]|nr:type II toxin-antitoxin system RelE/ParE family toxin [Chloroflexota bacterium]
MNYGLRIVPAAEREMRRLPRDVLQRVHERIRKLQRQPFAPGARKLAGGLGYRVRVGDYRIVFAIDEAQRAIAITSVRHRREAYR